jgi:hypothetical protein
VKREGLVVLVAARMQQEAECISDGRFLLAAGRGPRSVAGRFRWTTGGDNPFRHPAFSPRTYGPALCGTPAGTVQPLGRAEGDFV